MRYRERNVGLCTNECGQNITSIPQPHKNIVCVIVYIPWTGLS